MAVGGVGEPASRPAPLSLCRWLEASRGEEREEAQDLEGGGVRRLCVTPLPELPASVTVRGWWSAARPSLPRWEASGLCQAW